ncbi:High-potential iron-sulfur protein isozyme [Saliniradius amylolyticus]|uniref:High-potential iron-sulfur protein isozyme n=1 Tax=Saliniradius amylolyticus TaxID=2183582 RepID=A0A2S2E2Q9_9ALTE|nr:high-potential iron-sulfur protein [Saliniradius amylolyticus]AWL11946.1 High-potential iron-sulfur protein isozyme [Saliniradius amylolyticus]
MKALSRRDFLKVTGSALIGVTTGGVSLQALAKEQLPLDNPSAKALKYTHQSDKEGQTCANCMHIQGDAGNEWRPCALFPNHLVNNNGWCAGWVKQP